MLSTLADPRSEKGWAYEIKYDGYRILAAKQGKKVTLISRNRKDATTWFPEIVHAVQKLPGSFILDGELCLLDERGYPNFEGLRGIARPNRTKPANVAYYAFDLISTASRDCRKLPFRARKKLLFDIVTNKAARVNCVDYIEGDGMMFFEETVKAGLEGIVAKKIDSTYVGERSLNWLKFKAQNYHDGWKRTQSPRSP
jgi:bifunctional non-homologous end joining protein LigD